MIKAQAIFENKLGVDHPQLAITLRNLADLSRLKGNSETADRLERRAMEIWHEHLLPAQNKPSTDPGDFEALYGQRSEDELIKLLCFAAHEQPCLQSLYDMTPTATSLYELAILYRIKGRYRASVKLFANALEEVAPNSLSAVMILQQWAQSASLVDDHLQAAKLYVQGLSILQEKHLESHPDLPELYYGLARTMLANGSYDEAERLFVKAQTILETKIDNKHPRCAYILCGLAKLSKISKNYLEAELRYKQALDILQTVLGGQHLAIADICDEMAVLYQEQKNMSRLNCYGIVRLISLVRRSPCNHRRWLYFTIAWLPCIVNKVNIQRQSLYIEKR